jgi:hypothetical protein
MVDTQDEAAWRAEFERTGEVLVRDALNRGMYSHEPKRQAVFRWLSEEERARKLREQGTYRFAKWTFFAAVAAVFVGILGIVVTIAGIWMTMSTGSE